MKRKLLLVLLILPFTLLGQEKMSKKELREKKKKEKLEAAFQKLVTSVEDTLWVFKSMESNKTPSGIDYGIFWMSKQTITLDEVFIPDAKKVNEKKRISPYLATVKSYTSLVDESKNEIQISLVFEHEGSSYQMGLRKGRFDKNSTAEIRKNNALLINYEGKLTSR